MKFDIKNNQKLYINKEKNLIFKNNFKYFFKKRKYQNKIEKKRINSILKENRKKQIKN